MSVENCIFCKIADGQIPSERVFEDDVCVAFNDVTPQAPTHILIIPREHIDSLDKAGPEHEAQLGHLLATAANVNAEQLLAFDKILVTPSALEHLAERMNRA